MANSWIGLSNDPFWSGNVIDAIAARPQGIEFRRPDPGVAWQATQLCRSTQQLVDDGFDVNHRCIEKLDTRSAGVPQQQREFRACED